MLSTLLATFVFPNAYGHRSLHLNPFPSRDNSLRFLIKFLIFHCRLDADTQPTSMWSVRSWYSLKLQSRNSISCVGWWLMCIIVWLQIVVIDLILHKPEAYRHIFFNYPLLHKLNMLVLCSLYYSRLENEHFTVVMLSNINRRDWQEFVWKTSLLVLLLDSCTTSALSLWCSFFVYGTFVVNTCGFLQACSWAFSINLIYYESMVEEYVSDLRLSLIFLAGGECR